MAKKLTLALTVITGLILLAGLGCIQSSAGSGEASKRVAEEFVRLEATFRFDGIPDTLEVTSVISIGNGWEYTVEFDSKYAGYGNRSGQILAQVITHHTAEVTVQAGLVTRAVMDREWDMISQRTVDELEISQAPIHEVEVYFMESFPVQVGVHIEGGLRDGCTTFHDAVIYVEGSVINIFVTTQRPRDVSCPAIYTDFEKDVNLGSDFTPGTTYILKVNDYATTFVYQ